MFFKENNSTKYRAASTTKASNLNQHSSVPTALKVKVFPDQDSTNGKQD